MCLVPRKRLGILVNTTVVGVALVVAALDAITKVWARHALATHDIHVAGWLWWRLQFNSGVSFSFSTSGPLVTTILTAVVAIGVVLVGIRANEGLPAIGFGLLIGGGLGNVIDRLAATPHEVTDFISVRSFPVFNVADVCITIGFVLLLVAALRGDRILAK